MFVVTVMVENSVVSFSVYHVTLYADCLSPHCTSFCYFSASHVLALCVYW